MPARTPQERTLAAKIAAAERWARTDDRVAALEPARRGLSSKWEREVDPNGTLSPAERAYRAEQARRAHLLRASLAAARNRRLAAEHRRAAEAAEAKLEALGGDVA